MTDYRAWAASVCMFPGRMQQEKWVTPTVLHLFAHASTRRFMEDMGLTSLRPGIFDPLVALTQL